MSEITSDDDRFHDIRMKLAADRHILDWIESHPEMPGPPASKEVVDMAHALAQYTYEKGLEDGMAGVVLVETNKNAGD